MTMTNIKKHIYGLIGGFRWYLSTSFIPSFPSQRVRNWGMRKMGVNMTNNVKLFANFQMRTPSSITIEDGVSIGPKVLLDGRKGLVIRRNAVVAYEAIIWTLNHDYNDIEFCGKGASVEIGEYAWVCSRAIILPGVKIGKGAVVASGAIVTKDVEPWSIVGGIPAKKIGEREKKNYNYGYNRKNDYNHIV